MSTMNNTAAVRVNPAIYSNNKSASDTLKEAFAAFVSWFSVPTLTRDERCINYQETEEFGTANANDGFFAYVSSPVRF